MTTSLITYNEMQERMSNIDNQKALARRWRPQSFDTVVGQQHVVQTLRNALNQKYLHHAYLFTGTRGVGKTTIARILAKCLNCDKGVTSTPCCKCSNCLEIDNGHFPDLYEIDAASRTKVEDMRELLNNVAYAPTKGNYKIYLIDEVHMLSGHSFNALLKTLEEPPEHVKFLLATTDPQKIPSTILSRCLQFQLMQISQPEIAAHLQHILTSENIKFDESATQLIAKSARGSARDALSLLDQSIAYGNGSVLTNNVEKMLGTIDNDSLFKILNALSENNAAQILECTDLLANKGVDFSSALNDLLSIFHKITIAQVIPNDPNTQKNIQTYAQTLKQRRCSTLLPDGLVRST